MKKPVLIGHVNVRLPSGWQGDANHLARLVAEQLQQQASSLTSARQIEMRLHADPTTTPRMLAGQLAGKILK